DRVGPRTITGRIALAAANSSSAWRVVSVGITRQVLSTNTHCRNSKKDSERSLHEIPLAPSSHRCIRHFHGDDNRFLPRASFWGSRLADPRKRRHCRRCSKPEGAVGSRPALIQAILRLHPCTSERRFWYVTAATAPRA